MLAPDAEVSTSYDDLDAADSGRDETGVMHKSVLRYKVGTWRFEYSSLSEEEKQYMESIFPDAPTFDFEHPSRKDASIMEISKCYRSKYGISWRNARTGLWRGYSFSISEC